MMLQSINWLDELFLSTEIWGWFGPLALIVIAYIVTTKYKGLGIFFIIVESLITYNYLTLVSVESWYWWNIYLMVFGILMTMVAMIRY